MKSGKIIRIENDLIIIRIILILSQKKKKKQRTVRQYGVAEFADMNM